VLKLPRRPQPRWRLPNGTRYAAVAVLALAVVSLGIWNLSLGNQLESEKRAVARASLHPANPAMASTTGEVITLRQDSVTFVEFQHLPALPAGEIYELWLGTGDGKMEPAGVFSPEGDGSKVVVLTRDLTPYRLIAVTVEHGPAGSPVPTSSPGISGALA
jgi:hypothetical protein